MRKTFLATLLLAALTLQAQVTSGNNGSNDNTELSIDRQRYVIQYMMNYIKNPDKPKPQNELMQLEIGDRCTKFYSHTTMQRDSIVREMAKQGNFDFSNLKGGEIRWKLYKGYPSEGKTTQTEKVGLNYFKMIEAMTVPEWQLVGDSVTRILDYECRQATARFKGRTWTVWYTEDIPIAEGPWLLGGLPGLVMRAYDEQRHYVFEISGMRQVKSDDPVSFQETDYETISSKEMKKEMQKFCENPIGYMENDPAMAGSFTDDEGNALKSRPMNYNPLDLE